MSKSHNDPMNRREAAAGASESLGASAADAALEAGEAEIAKLRADIEDAGDRVLRAQAELDNYRKRARRELEDERRYATLPLLADLLPVLDNIQRAIAAAEKSAASGGLLDGVKMVAQSLIATLAKHDCQRIEALHHSFDPAFHQAISQQHSDEFPPNTVVLVAQDGYTLHDRVVRPAQVIVSTPAHPQGNSPRYIDSAPRAIEIKGNCCMPTYDYVCDACGHKFELFQSMKDEPERKCPQCKKLKLRRLFGAGGAIVFKGSGFYQTDYRSESYKKAASADSGSANGEGKSPKSSDSSDASTKGAGGSGEGGSREGGSREKGSKPKPADK